MKWGLLYSILTFYSIAVVPPLLFLLSLFLVLVDSTLCLKDMARGEVYQKWPLYQAVEAANYAFLFRIFEFLMLESYVI